jgi:hypothetical protein
MFSLLHSIHNDSEARLTSYKMDARAYKMDTRASFPRGKDQEYEAYLHLLPRIRKVELHLHSPTHLRGIVLN